MKKIRDKITKEKRFHALVENNGSISLIDRDKRSLFRSSSSSKLTGWTDEEFDETLKTNSPR
jgi:hypothetical protein